jgi:NitT/TauT family transport system substrate-binding protein
MNDALGVRLIAVLACGLFFLPASTIVAQPQAAIRVGMTAGDAFAEAYYAQEMGFFHKAGLRVEIRPFSTGTAVTKGLDSNAIDIGISNVINVSRSVARGAPYVFIAPGGLYTAKSPIVGLAVLRDAPIRGAKDLEGKNIGVTALGDTAQLGVATWVDNHGGSSAKVHFVRLTWADLEAGLENGLVDATLNAEPWLSAALNRGHARVLARPYDDIASTFVIGMWVTTASWYTKNRSLTRRFADAIYQTARWANSHRDQSAVLLSKYSQIDIQTIHTMTRALYAEKFDLSQIQPELDLAYRYRTIDRQVDASSLIAR